MKLELIKETEINGNIYYCIHKNDVYVSDTATTDFEEAKTLFEQMKKGITKTTEIIDTYESN